MGLTNKKEEQLRKMPLIEFHARKSKDGRYIVHQTIFTDIKPVKYYEKVVTSAPLIDAIDTNADSVDAAEKAADQIDVVTGDQMKA